MILFKLAVRNVLRHKVRTTLNVLMIVGSFTAVILFLGFTHGLMTSLEIANVRSVYGHVQIGKELYWNMSPVMREMERQLEHPLETIQKALKHPDVLYASPRTTFFALLSSGEKTVSGQGWGLDPKVETVFVESIPIEVGKNFSGQNDFEILLGMGMQQQLQAKIGDTITILSQTVDGAANAIDCDLKGIFQTGVSEIDNNTFIVTFNSAKRLLDTQTAERIIVMLKSSDSLVGAVGDLQKMIGEDSGITVKSWKSLSKLYQQTVSYFRVQNNVLNFILAVLVLLGIINTIGMSIFERTVEIGTCRALGDRRIDVLKQFFYEGLVLFFGSLLIGLPFSQLAVILVNALEIIIDIPGASLQMAIQIQTYPEAYFQATVVIFCSVIVATLIPAWNASRISIVEALRR